MEKVGIFFSSLPEVFKTKYLAGEKVESSELRNKSYFPSNVEIRRKWTFYLYRQLSYHVLAACVDNFTTIQ